MWFNGISVGSRRPQKLAAVRHTPKSHRRDTRFLRHESCAIQRLFGAFETRRAGYTLKLLHQINLSGKDFTDVRGQETAKRVITIEATGLA